MLKVELFVKTVTPLGHLFYLLNDEFILIIF